MEPESATDAAHSNSSGYAATVFTHTHTDTHSLLHAHAYTHRRLCTQTLLHADIMFYTLTALHTDAFTHRGFYTDAFTHKSFYTQKLLHTEAFTHRRLCTQKLFVGFLIRDSLGVLSVLPRVFKVSFRIQTGENRAKESGFNLAIL